MIQRKTLWILLLLATLPSSLWSTPECGRPASTDIYFKYFPGHRLRDSRDSSVLSIVNGTSGPTIVIYSPPQQHDPYFAASGYLISQGTKGWHSAPDEIASTTASPANNLWRTPSNSKVIYKRVLDLGLYLRSENGGQSWMLPSYSVNGVNRVEIAIQTAHDSYHHLVFTILAVDPKQPLSLYASLKAVPWSSSLTITSLPSYDLPGIYFSADGGESWKLFTNYLLTSDQYGAPYPPPLGISPVDPSIMLGVAPRGAIVESLDGGQHWQEVGQQKYLRRRPDYFDEHFHHATMLGAPGGIEVSQFMFDPSDKNIMYIVSNKGIYRTVDGGYTWCLLNLGFDEINAINSLVLNPMKPSELFVGSRYGTFRSRDGGCHFDRIYPTR